jgi:heme A synthase
LDIVRLIHRILGETLLLIALLGVVLAIAGLVRKQVLDKPERIFGLVYAGLLDLQALLGLANIAYLLSLAGWSLLTVAFILHPILMILAVIVVHASKRWREGSTPTRHWAQLGAYGASLVLIFAGRMILA